MGVEKGMDTQCDKIRLFSVQRNDVVDIIMRDGVSYSKKEYVKRKYEESAAIFLTAYTWLAKEATKYVPKPERGELHYWAFENTHDFERHSGSSVLIMDVPIQECILFDLYDWNKILKLEYIGESRQDEQRFHEHIHNMGIKHDSDIMLTAFYPQLKQEIEKSWQRLFQYQAQLVKGERPVASVEAALWQIKKSWIVEVEG